MEKLEQSKPHNINTFRESFYKTDIDIDNTSNNELILILEKLFLNDKFDDAINLHKQIKLKLRKECLELILTSEPDKKEKLPLNKDINKKDLDSNSIAVQSFNTKLMETLIEEKIIEIYKNNISDKRLTNLKLVLDEDEMLLNISNDILDKVNNTKPEREHKGIKSWFFYNEKISTITLCNRCIVKAPVLHIMTVLAELDLMKNFIKSIDSMDILGNITLFRFLLHSKISIPSPISNREMIGYGIGSIDKKNKSIMMPFKSICDGNKEYCSVPIPEVSTKYKRVYVEFGFFHIKVINDNECEITQCINTNPKVSFVPLFIINKILKEISYYMTAEFMKEIERSYQENIEMYNKRRIDKPEFYTKIKDELCRLD